MGMNVRLQGENGCKALGMGCVLSNRYQVEYLVIIISQHKSTYCVQAPEL